MRDLREIMGFGVAAILLALAHDSGAQGQDSLPGATELTPSAAEMREQWILDGPAQVVVRGERELEVTATGPMALWCPEVFEGRVIVAFECMVPEPGTKLLVLVHGHGTDGAPIREWKRDGTYDGYNAGRMELYTIAINRGPHISDRSDDRLANVRRIGGPQFGKYTAADFQKHGRDGRAFWDAWNTLSLIGAAQEPAGGTGKFFRHRIEVDPPHVRLAMEGAIFAEMVDHRANPLARGSVGFRCMTRGKTFVLRNVAIEGRAKASGKAID